MRRRCQVQTPAVVLVTEGRPVVLIRTTRSLLPTVGVARHTVNTAEVAPVPVGWNTMRVTAFVSVIFQPPGMPACFCSTSGVAPPVLQVVASSLMHMTM